jgi:hypothetical protein
VGKQDDGYKVLGTSEGRRVGAVVSVRLKPDEVELLSALAEQRGATLSETLRQGLHCLMTTPRSGSGSITRGHWEEELVRGQLSSV